MDARYVFRVTYRPRPVDADAETTVTVARPAPEPGTDGWLFFRNALWRGAVADEAHARGLAADWLDEPPEAIETVDFRELQTDEAYFEAMKAEMAADLTPFKADHVSAALSKYLGSSIRVVDETGDHADDAGNHADDRLGSDDGG